MVAVGNLGSDDMKSPSARRKRRATALEIAFSLLETQKEGLRVSYIQRIISDSCRFTCSRNALGQFMKRHIDSGRVEASRTTQGHMHWKLNPVYIPVMETD